MKTLLSIGSFSVATDAGIEPEPGNPDLTWFRVRSGVPGRLPWYRSLVVVLSTGAYYLHFRFSRPV